MPYRTLSRALLTATAVIGFGAAPALAEMVAYHAELTAAAAGTDSAGMGMLEGELDTETNTFSWNVTYEGLTGPVSAAHFHGPAGEGETAPPVLPVEDLDSPMTGNALLTDEQITQLQSGAWYFNVHTEMYPDGEIRGQVLEGTYDEMSSPATDDEMMSDDDSDDDDMTGDDDMSDDNMSDDDGNDDDGASVDAGGSSSTDVDVDAGGVDVDADVDAEVDASTTTN